MNNGTSVYRQKYLRAAQKARLVAERSGAQAGQKGFDNQQLRDRQQNAVGDTIIAMSELFGVSIDELIYGENAEVLSTKHLAAEQKRAVADLLQGLTLYNDGNDKDGLARTRLLLQVIKAMGL